MAIQNHEVAIAGKKFFTFPVFCPRKSVEGGLVRIDSVVRILTELTSFSIPNNPNTGGGSGAPPWLTDLGLSGSLHSPLRDMQNPH